MNRKELEGRENRELALYGMRSADSRGRVYPDPERSYRTAFQRDRDRIVHSTAFRRLEYKTQVFVNHEGDYYRTRLTHTMEVAQLARTVARAMGLNEDLVEGIALAHDLGHTPFGHSGEDAISELMADHGGFEHNGQSLRIVELLEVRYPEFPGLNLTYELRESLVKHQTRYDHPDASGYHPDEGPLLESQVVDFCDSIAYHNHDIDDGVKSGMLTVDDMLQVTLFRETWEAVNRRHPDCDKKVAFLSTVRKLIGITVTDLINASEAAIESLGIETIHDVRNCKEPIIRMSGELSEKKDELGDFLFDNLYRHYRVAKMAEKAKRFLSEMWHEYVRYPGSLPPRFQESAEEEGIQRAVCDYIAGMTDRYAQEEYQRLFHPFERI
ncbi:MAG: deoxyguanosinetriphosphate triphosphohydrolase [Planctomycetota bacterium]|nr:deoxyguanosinetriphosphate triphosphohydrolase [Planctomycetota bacterium]